MVGTVLYSWPAPQTASSPSAIVTVIASPALSPQQILTLHFTLETNISVTSSHVVFISIILLITLRQVMYLLQKSLQSSWTFSSSSKCILSTWMEMSTRSSTSLFPEKKGFLSRCWCWAKVWTSRLKESVLALSGLCVANSHFSKSRASKG